MKEGYVNLEWGKLYYKTIGKGEPIVFVHGGPGLVHDYFLPHFLELSEKGYELIFYDQRGNGKSYIPYEDSKISLDMFTEDIEKLRVELKLDKVNIIGHSMGGFFALDYAKNFSEHVNRVVVCNSIPFRIIDLQKIMETMNVRVKEYIAKQQDENKGLNSELDINILVAFYNKELAFKLDNSLQNNKEFAEALGNINRKLLGEYPNKILNYDLSNIKNDTLIICSDYDFIPLEGHEYMKNKIKVAELKIIENCGHYSFIEKKDEVINVIDKFLKQ